MNNRYAITFGEVAILHIGGKEYGKGRLDHGFSTDELKLIASNNYNTEYISISDKLPQNLRKDNEAGILIFRSNSEKNNSISKKFIIGLNQKEADKLYLDWYVDIYIYIDYIYIHQSISLPNNGSTQTTPLMCMRRPPSQEHR